MAPDKPLLTVILQPRADADLWEVWKWNAERYGVDHAEGYEAFLKEGLNGLAVNYDAGKLVEGFPELKSLTMRRGRGDGHIAIYEVDVDAGTVNVLHIYHTKMDVRGRLQRDRTDDPSKA